MKLKGLITTNQSIAPGGGGPKVGGICMLSGFGFGEYLFAHRILIRPGKLVCV